MGGRRELTVEDYTTFVCYTLKATMKKVEKFIGTELDRFGLNLAQSFVLFTLMENDGSTLSEIGNRAQIENSSLTTMVDKLEREKLVERRLCSQDRRVIRLFLTDKGRDLAQKVYQHGESFNNFLRKELGVSQDSFLDGLVTVASSIDRLSQA